ncbi:MAG: methyltransferase domain-containing protein [Bryobacterales bacterium]|nr:methyltransferase domain-containing protein [Bryobacterales bacterium]
MARSVLIRVVVPALVLCACDQSPKLDFNRGLDVPYVQTPAEVVDKMMEIARVTPADTLIDLGCGDGRIVIAAARRGARSIGYDLDPERIAEAREQASRAGVAALASFVQADFFKAGISRATVLTMFMIPTVVERITPRLESDLAPGTRVVSHSFPIKGWRGGEKIEVAGRTLYLYSVPPRPPLRRY